jgi:hypothetical protein
LTVCKKQDASVFFTLKLRLNIGVFTLNFYFQSAKW